jgi:hypothetical protein
MLIDLNDDERLLLAELLNAARGDLREEIYKTEATDYKRDLKDREKTLEALIQKVSA